MECEDAAITCRMADEECNRMIYCAEIVMKLSSAIQGELLTGKIVQYYTEWCQTQTLKEPGVCFKDTCIKFDKAGNVQILKSKSPNNNIYVYIEHSLGDPYKDDDVKMLNDFLDQTFWNNTNALEFYLAAMCLALMGEKY